MSQNYKNRLAVVTGASSGLGVEFAKAFAARGANLVLVARREDRLNTLASEITQKHSVQVETLVLDLSLADSGDKLLAELRQRNLNVDILVNNAGFGTGGRIANENRDRVKEEINLNVLTLTDLTIGVLPSMLRQNFGVIINVASTASYQPVPGLAVYSATKAYVRSFTEALWGELDKTGVRAITLSPGATATEFFDVAGTTPAGKLVDPARVIQTVLNELDKPSSKPSVIDGFRNRLMAGISRLAPRKILIRVAGSLFLPKD